MTDTFTPPSPLQTAVLFLVFNRPDTTAQVFKAIRKAKPPRLYVAADGPRFDRQGEVDKVAKVREIATAIDWSCEVKTLFREKNLGCKSAVGSGITWFFEHEEHGIILEDDCLPKQSFFWFCEEMLQKYKEDQSIGIISGNNFFDQTHIRESSYYFSIHGGIWGWATWARIWKNYMPHKKHISISYKNMGLLKNILTNKKFRVLYMSQVCQASSGDIDSWAIPFSYMRYLNMLYCVRPKINLVSNIGLGHPDSTHTKTVESESIYDANEDLTFPLKHPSKVIVDSEADDRLVCGQIKKKSFIHCIKAKLLIILIKLLGRTTV